MEGPPNLLVHRSDGRFRISAYNVDLPSHFRAIKAELAADLNADNVTYLATEHIGSTSVPDLRAKVIIDILLVIAADEFHEAKRQQILEALSGKKSGQGAYHNNNGDGGVKGRWTLKLNGIWPYRSLYVVAHGSIPHRNPIALRDTLRKDEGLRNEYERIKRDLAKRTKREDLDQYSVGKTPIIRKIWREQDGRTKKSTRWKSSVGSTSQCCQKSLFLVQRMATWSMLTKRKAVSGTACLRQRRSR